MPAVVTIRIEFEATGRTVEGPAILNGGFASRSPCVLVPRLAALLVLLDYPAGTIPLSGRTAGGRTSLREAQTPARCRIVTTDREGPVASFRFVVSEIEDEILVSDFGIDALGVKIERHGEGLWRFADEDRVRTSAPRRSW